MNSLINDVLNWAAERDLLKEENATRQMLKVTEEVGEIAGALAKNDTTGLIDAIGDTMVTLIILADQKGLSIEQCLKVAYLEIQARTGKTVDGVFIKD